MSDEKDGTETVLAGKRAGHSRRDGTRSPPW